MSETKFTQGPWRVEEDADGLYIVMDALINERSDADEALMVYAASSALSTEQREADAYLIAAAPEMYAALERLYEWERSFEDIDHRALKMGLPPIERPGSSSYVDTWLETHIYGPVESALKKARGES